MYEMEDTVMLKEWTEKWVKTTNLHFCYLEKTTSTNDIAKNLLKKSQEPFLVFTNYQTKGRGRGGATWTSPPPGTSLQSSWCFPLNSPPQPITSPLIGLALYKTLKSTWVDLDYTLKPPNDIYINGKKILGLLIETVSQGDYHKIIIGLGINIFAQPEVDGAGYLQENLHQPISAKNWFKFLDTLLAEFSWALGKCIEKKLEPTDCTSLLEALNPFDKERAYKAVETDGSLVSESGMITKWSSL